MEPLRLLHDGPARGDLGQSYQRKLPVTDIFLQKYPYTVKLAACAIVLEAIMGIGAGIISAVKRYSFWDILVTLTTSVLVAVAAFWLGMLLQLFFRRAYQRLDGRRLLPAHLRRRRPVLSVSGLDYHYILPPPCSPLHPSPRRTPRAHHALSCST